MTGELRPRSTVWIWLTLLALVAAATAYVFAIAPWLERRDLRKRVAASIADAHVTMRDLEQCVLGPEVAPAAWSETLLRQLYTSPKFFERALECHRTFLERAQPAARAFSESSDEDAKVLGAMMAALTYEDPADAWALPMTSLAILCEHLAAQHDRLAALARRTGHAGIDPVAAHCKLDREPLAASRIELPEPPRDAGRALSRVWIDGDTLLVVNEYDRVTEPRKPPEWWVDLASSRRGASWEHEIVRHAWVLAREGNRIWGVGRLPGETAPRILGWNAMDDVLEPGRPLSIGAHRPVALRTVGTNATFVSMSERRRHTAVRVPATGDGRPTVTEFARDKPYDEPWGFYVADDGTVGALGVVGDDSGAVFEVARSPAPGKSALEQRPLPGLAAELTACSTGARQWALIGFAAVLTTTDGGATWSEAHRFEPLLDARIAMCRADSLVLVGKQAGGVAHRESICRPDGCSPPAPLTVIESKWVAAGWTDSGPAFLVGFGREDLGAILLRDDRSVGDPVPAAYFRSDEDAGASAVWYLDDVWYTTHPDDGLTWQ